MSAPKPPSVLAERSLEDDLPDSARAILSRFLEPSESAPSLFSAEDLDAACGAGNNPVFTARYLRERSPRLYRAIVALSGADYSLREVSQLLGVSKSTVSAVIESEPDALGTLKQRTAKALRRAAHRMAERIMERADDIPLASLGVNLGIVTDKAQLLEGEATAIIESRPSARHSDWEATLAEVQAVAMDRANAREVEAEVLLLPATGSLSGSDPQKGVDQDPEGEAGSPLPDGIIDSESIDLPSLYTVTESDAGTDASNPATNPGGSEPGPLSDQTPGTGGGGGSKSATPPHDHIDREPGEILQKELSREP